MCCSGQDAATSWKMQRSKIVASRCVTSSLLQCLPVCLCMPYFLGDNALNREQTISQELSVIHRHRDLSVFVFASSPLSAIFLTLAICACLRPQAVFNSKLQKPVAWQHQRACVNVCVWLLHHFPIHSYEPCSVFIDAVYFVPYQINNKAQTWPEEQKEEAIHTWVGSIYIRSLSTVHLLCVCMCTWVCVGVCAGYWRRSYRYFLLSAFMTEADWAEDLRPSVPGCIYGGDWRTSVNLQMWPSRKTNDGLYLKM